MGILAREIFRADAGTAADAHVLKHAVIDEGEGFRHCGSRSEKMMPQ